MAFSGGVYTLPTPALVPGQIVSSSENNTVRNDMAASFNLTWLRNGTAAATANIPMGSYKLTGLGAATTSGDALSYGAAAVVTTLTSTSLTATRVPYAGTGGLLQDASTFTFDGTTLTAGGFTTSGAISAGTITASGAITVSGGTANGVAYLNGSKVLTTGSALTFDGTSLAVTGAATVTGDISTTSTGRLNVRGSGTGVNYDLQIDNSDTLVNFRASRSNAITKAYAWYLDNSVTEGMRLTSTGLGIGTSSPNYKLEVSQVSGTRIAHFGNSSDGNRGLMILNTGAGAAGTSYIGTNGGGYALTFGTGGSTQMTLDTSGNVGIGTSSPSYRLDVRSSNPSLNVQATTGTNQTSLLLQNSGGSFYVGIDNSSGTSYGAAAYARSLWSDGAYPMAFFTNSTERMRIDSSGNLLVGTTSNSDFSTTLKFYSVSSTYAGAFKTTGGASYECLGLWNTATSGTIYQIRFYDGGAGVRGSVTTNGTSTSFNTSSDYRLKENIQPMQNALGVVAQLNPVTYTWKADGSDGQGFIAHELQAVVPDCVTGEKDAVDEEGKPVYQGIDTSFLVATLTKAIQEQQEQINQLKAEVAALKAK